MATRKSNMILTGNDKRLGLSFYYSSYFGLNIIRSHTSLTGERVKKDKAFTGFRLSGNRMKEASPIAAALYKMIPVELKQFSLYRILTGEAIKMLKKGEKPDRISETLKRIYINPLIEVPVIKIKSSERPGPVKQNVSLGVGNFTRLLPITLYRRRFLRKQRHSQKQSTGILLHPEKNKRRDIYSSNEKTFFSTKESTTGASELLKSPVSVQKADPELKYLGRLPECKYLKMWIRSAMSV